MKRALWPHRRHRPAIRLELAGKGTSAFDAWILADSGAGPSISSFELLLHESWCRGIGRPTMKEAILGGAYVGSFPTFLVRVRIPALGFDRRVLAVGVSEPPEGFDGIACFRFLNRFTFGNFGHDDQFGLEA